MNPEQYTAEQAAITSGLALYVKRFAELFAAPALPLRGWSALLQTLFPEVQRRYRESSYLGRAFYDSERELHHPQLPRNDQLIGDLDYEWFTRIMEPARKGLSQADSPPSAVSRVALTAVREVEMAARRQILRAVKDEPEPQVLRGWARVATGRETCAWCLMLISRGAVIPDRNTEWYLEAATAGINLDDETVIDLFNEAGVDLDKFREEVKDDLDEWHTGCDCLVVPVFDVNNWPGRNSANRAMQLWIAAGKEADRLIAAGKSNSDNVHKETLNVLRRRLGSGDIHMSDYAVAA